MTGKRAAEWNQTIEPGLYWRDLNGHWCGVTPNGLLAGLRNHTVTEHEDGTISVTPSILVKQPQGDGAAKTWHGYLARGVWMEC